MNSNYPDLCLLKACMKTLSWYFVTLETWRMRCVNGYLLWLLYFTCYSLCLIQLLLIFIQVVGFLLLNLYLNLAWDLHSIINKETISEASLSSLLSKRNNLFEELGYFLNLATDNKEGGKHASELACRVRAFWYLFLNSFSTSSIEILYFLNPHI